MPPVLNGLAFDAATSHLYVTGKQWGTLYRMQMQLPPTCGELTCIYIYVCVCVCVFVCVCMCVFVCLSLHHCAL